MTSKIENSDETDDAYFLARNVCDHMLMRMELMKLQPKRIVVLGLVAGYSVNGLKQRFPAAEINVIEKIGEESLPLADGSVDLIFANLFLPWVDNLTQIFKEWRRLLRVEGLLMFTSFGPDTLIELREVF